MLPTLKFALFYFIFDYFLLFVYAVKCHHCNDNAPPLGHEAAACVFITGVAANVAAMNESKPLSIRSLLPSYLVNLFGTKLLSFLVSLKNLPTALGAYDFTGKVPAVIVKDLTEGVCK